jgi:hypothetical protein
MTPKRKYIKYTLTLILLIIIADTIMVGQDTLKLKVPKLYIGVSAGPSINKITFGSSTLLPGLLSKDKTSFSASADLGYFFSNNFGISTGLKYSSYSGTLTLDSYSSNFSATDTENEIYERRVSATSISEQQNISFLTIPVCLNLRFSAGKRFSFYLKGGAGLSLPVKSSFTSSGNYSFAGYYQAYNILLQNLPDYGFPSNTDLKYSGSMEMNSIIVDGTAGAGMGIFISDKTEILIGADYTRSLTTILGYSSPENFQLSLDTNKINSMMGGTNKVTAEAIGINISFRYYFR